MSDNNLTNSNSAFPFNNNSTNAFNSTLNDSLNNIYILVPPMQIRLMIKQNNLRSSLVVCMTNRQLMCLLKLVFSYPFRSTTSVESGVTALQLPLIGTGALVYATTLLLETLPF